MNQHVDVKPQDLIDEYLALRTWKEAEEKRFEEEMKEKAGKRMKQIENIILGFLNDIGSDKFGITGQGVAYKQRAVSCRTADMEAYRAYVISTGEFDQAEMKPNKSLITQMVDAGQEPPPGVNWSAINVVRFRKD